MKTQKRFYLSNQDDYSPMFSGTGYLYFNFPAKMTSENFSWQNFIDMKADVIKCAVNRKKKQKKNYYSFFGADLFSSGVVCQAS